MTSSAHDAGSSDFETLARQYFGAWGDALRHASTPGAPAGGDPGSWQRLFDWWSQLLPEQGQGAPEDAEDVPERFEIPRRLPSALVQALEAKLARMAGLAAFALLMGVTYRGGRRGHMLAIVGAAEGAREALAHAVREAVVFSGLEAGVLDVTFLTGEEEVLGRMVQVARRFDIPAPEVRERAAPAAPGSDPERPPKLR